MANFFCYNQMPEILIDKLSSAELKVYKAVKGLASAVKNATVFATIEYLVQHTTCGKSAVSKALNGLVDKGLLVRDLVKSSKSRHRCYQYYIVYDLTCTKLYQTLTPEEKQKYVVSTEDKTYRVLSTEENNMYCYLKYQIGISDLTHKKMLILLECARNNSDIAHGTELETIRLMSKYCMKADNRFGYLKKTIINYSTEPKATYVPVDKIDTDETVTTEEHEKLNKACDKMLIRLSAKQINAIVCVANKLKISIARVLGIMDKCRYIKGIKDIFVYILGSLYRENEKDVAMTSFNDKENQSYSYCDFDSLAITLSKNTKARDKELATMKGSDVGDGNRVIPVQSRASHGQY